MVSLAGRIWQSANYVILPRVATLRRSATLHLERVTGFAVLDRLRMSTIDPRLLEMLVCPLSRAPLVVRGDWLYSTDSATRRRYPIRDGLPIMLIDAAETVDAAEFERIMAEAKPAAPLPT